MRTGKPLSSRFSITTEAVLLFPEPLFPVINDRPVRTSTTGSSTGDPGSAVASPPIPSLTSATWIVSASLIPVRGSARLINHRLGRRPGTPVVGESRSRLRKTYAAAGSAAAYGQRKHPPQRARRRDRDDGALVHRYLAAPRRRGRRVPEQRR